MQNLFIITVKDYNTNQPSNAMKVLSKKGSPMRVGYVVCFNGDFIYKSTKKRAEAVTVGDFKSEELPVHWNDCGMSNDSYLNS